MIILVQVTLRYSTKYDTFCQRWTAYAHTCATSRPKAVKYSLTCDSLTLKVMSHWIRYVTAPCGAARRRACRAGFGAKERILVHFSQVHCSELNSIW